MSAAAATSAPWSGGAFDWPISRRFSAWAISTIAFVSAFVMEEPAPYELLLGLTFVVWIIFGLRLNRYIVPMVGLLLAYLAGGFLWQLVDFMRRGPLVERFLDKGVMRPFLHKVPIRVVDHGQLGVIGAASWYLDVRAEGASNAGPAPISPVQFHQQASENALRGSSRTDGSR